MKLCKLCHKNKAELPDRDSGSLTFRKAICRECHAARLAGDFANIAVESIGSYFKDRTAELNALSAKVTRIALNKTKVTAFVEGKK